MRERGRPEFQGTVHPDFRSVASAFGSMLPKRAGGASLAVMHRGELVVDVWGGTRDEHGSPFEADTLALSFSTTKGVMSTLAHIFASRGELDYDAKVARYWPAFAANGKQDITVRNVMRHEAGLYPIRPLIDDAHQMLDWEGMLRRIEGATPVHAPGEGTGYHALTYGWLVGGLLEHIAQRPLAEILRDDLATPLRLRGCFIGLPESELHRRAQLIGLAKQASNASPKSRANRPPSVAHKLRETVIRSASTIAGMDPANFAEAMFPPGVSRFDWNAEATVRAAIPGAGGMFDARSLARVYAMLANGGELDGVRVMGRQTAARIAQVESTRRDRVLPMPMNWRLGFHRVISIGGNAPTAFGHFGFGGSGAFADPTRNLSVAFVLNHGVGTPFGDARMWHLNGAVLRAADRRR